MTTPEARAGLRALATAMTADVADWDDAAAFYNACTGQTVLSLLSENERLEAALASVRGLRVTSASIHAALKSLGNPGYWEEGIVMVAAIAAADALAALADAPAEGRSE
jgi:hypothetical protein